MDGVFFQESARMNKQLWEHLRFALHSGQVPSMRGSFSDGLKFESLD